MGSLGLSWQKEESRNMKKDQQKQFNLKNGEKKE